MGNRIFQRLWVSFIEIFSKRTFAFKYLWFRFICKKELNNNKTDCVDFEARFCCETSVMNTQTCSNNFTNNFTTTDFMTTNTEPSTSLPTISTTTSISSHGPLSYQNLIPPKSLDDLRNFRKSFLTPF